MAEGQDFIGTMSILSQENVVTLTLTEIYMQIIMQKYFINTVHLITTGLSGLSELRCLILRTLNTFTAWCNIKIKLLKIILFNLHSKLSKHISELQAPNIHIFNIHKLFQTSKILSIKKLEVSP